VTGRGSREPVTAPEPWEIPPPPAPRGRRGRVGMAAGVAAIVLGLGGLAATLYVGGFLGGVRAPSPSPAPGPVATARLGEAIRDQSGLVVRVDAVRIVPLADPVPGRVGVVLRVTLTNRGTRPLAISSPRVRLAAGIPADPGRYDGTLAGTLAPGGSDTGEYAFAVRRAALPGVEVTVSGSGGRRLVFAGEVS
jgi:hypothetical protein